MSLILRRRQRLRTPRARSLNPAITDAVDVSHESVDANPREGTSPAQNAIDWNDPNRVRPDEADFTGQGIDRAVYGKVQD